MSNSQEKLQELLPSDQYGPEWKAFVKKWRPFAKEGYYYVQFTNNSSFTDKSAYETPDHTDPVGVYGYPLSYVLSHPGDIWYGPRAHYARVLKEVDSRHTLRLQYIDDYDINNWLRNLKLYDGKFDKARRKLGHKGSNANVKTFFSYIQTNMSDFWETGKTVARPGKEQTALLRKLGFWAIEDTATRPSQAIINEREPLQICFLIPQAFEIKDVINLHNKENKWEGMTVAEPGKYKMRALAQRIAQEVFGESLAPKQLGHVGLKTYSIMDIYWTQSGRRIKIDARSTDTPFSRGLGEKPHKLKRQDSWWYYFVEIYSEKGESTYKMSSTDESVDSFISRIKQDISSSPDVEGFVPEGPQEFVSRKNKEREEEIRRDWQIKNDADYKDYLETEVKIFEEFSQWSGIDLSEIINLDKEAWEFRVKMLNELCTWYRGAFDKVPHNQYRLTPEENEGVFTNYLNFYDKTQNKDWYPQAEWTVGLFKEVLSKTGISRYQIRRGDFATTLSGIMNDAKEKEANRVSESLEKLTEAVKYSYYSKWLTEDLFNTILANYDPTSNKYFGRWIIETFIKTVLKPMVEHSKNTNAGSNISEEKRIEILNLVLLRQGISTTIRGYILDSSVEFNGISSGYFNESDYNLRDALETFYEVRTQLPPDKRDIMSYSTFKDLIMYVRSKEVSDIEEKIRLSKVGKDEYNVIYKDDNWFIVHPVTEPATCKYGAQTKWCTAGRDDNRFDYYNYSGPIIIFIEKIGEGKVRKTQVHTQSGQWMDEGDNPIDKEDFLKRIPKDALLPIYKETQAFEFLPEEKLTTLSEVLLDTNPENKYLTLIAKRYKGSTKPKTFQEYSPRNIYFSQLFGEKIGKYAFIDVTMSSGIYDNLDNYNYDEGYNKPWDYLEEDPEYAEDIEECSVCKGDKYGLYVWNNELHDYDTSLTPEEFEKYSKMALTYDNSSPEKYGEMFPTIYKRVGDRYHVVNKDLWKKFMDGTSWKCPKCRGSGKELGIGWNRDIDLWSEDQKERAGQEAEQKAMDYEIEEGWITFNRYDWDDYKYSDEIMDAVLDLLVNPEETGIPREEKINTIRTLLKFASYFDINIPIPEQFTIEAV